MSVRQIINVLASAVLLIVVASRMSQAQELAVLQAQQRLSHLTVPDDMDTDVPAPVKGAITDLKQALATQTDAIMIRLPAKATAEAAQEQLSTAMPAETSKTNSDDKWGRLTVSVKQPKPSLLLVEESFEIACGSDTVLLAYGNETGAWKRTLLWQSDPYDQISGAFGDVYETRILKPERDHRPLLLVVHGTPWCTSTDSVFAMDIFQLGGASPAKPIWHADHDYRRFDGDPPLTLRPTPDGFEIRTSISTSGDRISRTAVIRYAVTADGIHRVEPIAMNGRDSVEEWLRMPRKEATEFADEPAGSLTWKVFQDFTYEGKSKDDTSSMPYPSLGAVRACKDAKTHFQVDVTSEFLGSSEKSNPPGPAYFVQLSEVPNGYRVHAITQVTDKSCMGPDLSR